MPDCRPPAYALTIGGRWEQLKPGAATHLPFRAGHNQMCHGRSGSAWGAVAPHVFFVFDKIRKFILESLRFMVYNT